MAYYNAGRIALNIHAEPELSWESRVQVLDGLRHAGRQ